MTINFGNLSDNLSFPSIRPTLDFNFVKSTVLDPRITFTRTNNTATYFNSLGILTIATANVPRFDFDPITLQSRGLLIEDASTNVRTFSDAITTSSGYSAGSVNLTQETIQTPTGTVATKLVLDLGASTGDTNVGSVNFGSGISLSTSTQYSQSIFAKSAGSTVLRLRNNALGGTADFSLTGNGTAPGLTIGIQAASITALGNGWYRCAWTFTTTTTIPGNRGDYWAIKTNVNDGVGGIYLCGAQLEVGPFTTSYIPTTSFTVTRGADTVSVNTLSPWYNQLNGTVYAEFTNGFQGTANLLQRNPGLWSFTQNGLGQYNGYGVRLVTWSNFSDTINGISRYAPSGLINQISFGPSAFLNLGQIYKTTFAWDSSQIVAARDGETPITDNNTAASAMGTHDQLYLGRQNVGGLPINLNGWLRRFTYYPARLINSEFQILTS